MKRWWHNWRRLWSRAEWFYMSKIEGEYEIITNREGLQSVGPHVWTTYYYSACNTSGVPHWFIERRRADTIHKADIKALLEDLSDEEVWIWTREEFDAQTKELITDAVFEDIK